MARIDHSPSRRIRSLNWMIQKELTGDQTNRISDGSHTFGDLYFHRAVLFAALLKAYPDKSWRSKVQSDGHCFPGYFLCGIQTPEGQYTYHYQLSQWDLFDGVRELPESPAYDGHKPEDVTRLLSLSEPDKLYRVKVYGIDLPALFYWKRDDGTLSFVQGGAGQPETEFTMDEIEYWHLENCEREEVIDDGE